MASRTPVHVPQIGATMFFSARSIVTSAYVASAARRRQAIIIIVHDQAKILAGYTADLLDIACIQLCAFIGLVDVERDRTLHVKARQPHSRPIATRKRDACILEGRLDVYPLPLPLRSPVHQCRCGMMSKPHFLKSDLVLRLAYDDLDLASSSQHLNKANSTLFFPPLAEPLVIIRFSFQLQANCLGFASTAAAFSPIRGLSIWCIRACDSCRCKTNKDCPSPPRCTSARQNQLRSYLNVVAV